MPEPARANAARNLPRCWRRWTSAVAACARRSLPSGLTVAAYAALYRELLAACSAAAAAATGPEREFYEMLERMVRPWLTLDTLVRTDGEILGDLLRRCQDAERRLRGRKPRLPSGRVLSAGTAGVIALLLVVALLVFALDWWPASLTSRFRVVADEVWYAWRELGQTTQMLVVGGVAVVFLIALVGRWAGK